MSVAVIDIGSNSIKILVAGRDDAGAIHCCESHSDAPKGQSNAAQGNALGCKSSNISSPEGASQANEDWSAPSGLDNPVSINPGRCPGLPLDQAVGLPTRRNSHSNELHSRDDATSAPVSLFYKTLDARIGAGISRANPLLTREAMERGIAAICELLAEASRFSVGRTILVATSAVREAINGAEFCRRVRDATGHDIRILTGAEEAGYIGRGLACDPALAGLRDFYVFDLGGGSLECLAFRDRRVVGTASLPLGCVRLTEQFVANPALPISPEALRAIGGHVKATLGAGSGGLQPPDEAKPRLIHEHITEKARNARPADTIRRSGDSGFAFDLPAAATLIITGGTTATARAVLGAAAGLPLEETSPRLALDELRALLGRVAGADLAARRAMGGMPFGRADVFPAALAIIVALAEAAGFSVLQTSFYNLRWGVADEALAEG